MKKSDSRLRAIYAVQNISMGLIAMRGISCSGTE